MKPVAFYKSCPNCGCRVYKRGCVNCNEENYIQEQIDLTDQTEVYETNPDRSLTDKRFSK